MPSDIQIIEGFQSNAHTPLVNIPFYVTNHTLRTDCQDETKRGTTTAKNLITRLVNAGIASGRPKKQWPRDLLVPAAGNLK
jgi:hypothetical protein